MDDKQFAALLQSLTQFGRNLVSLNANDAGAAFVNDLENVLPEYDREVILGTRQRGEPTIVVNGREVANPEWRELQSEKANKEAQKAASVNTVPSV